MKLNVRIAWFAGVLLSMAPCVAEDQIPWVADFRTACGMAAEQRRLVLLHFYSDNCGPCVRLEQNVFNRPEVGEAVAHNYLAVKVHAGKNPQLASRYHVNQWPTDVFVTPSGLEVYRTISPREAPDYIALLNQVAQQTGIGAGRSWKNQLAEAAQNIESSAAAAASKTAADTARASQFIPAGLQPASNLAETGMKSATSPFQMAADQARAATSQVGSTMQQTQQQVGAAIEQTQQQSAAAIDQVTGTANKWSQQARNAVDRYEQQGGEAYRQFREKADQIANQAQDNMQTAQQEWRSSSRQVAQEAGQTAQNLKNQWERGPASSLLDRRSAFVPAESSPASQPPAPAGAGPLPQIVNQPVPQPVAPPIAAPPAKPQTSAVAANQALLPTENPWVTNRQAQKSSSDSSPKVETTASADTPTVTPSPVATTSPSINRAPELATSPPFIPAQPEPPSSPSSHTASPAAIADNKQPFVPASQAPPLALDGFCPVTLMETMAKNPADRGAWKKGDRSYGAIHRGRTYLFLTPEAQQRFLANPDAFAPVLAGCDPVRFAERGELVDGKRAYGLLTPDKKMVLFADEASRNRFEQSPGNFTPVIQQAMLRGDGGSLYR